MEDNKGINNETVCISPPTNFLNDKWNLYYHLPNDSKWDLSSYTIIFKGIELVEQIIALTDAVPDAVVKSCMLFLMRDGITPLWEDSRNRNGGCFSFKVMNKQVPDIWKTLSYLICGESLTVDPSHYKHVNGITISPKKHFCIIKIWLDTTQYQDPNIITPIPNLSFQGCLFRKHAPEF